MTDSGRDSFDTLPPTYPPGDLNQPSSSAAGRAGRAGRAPNVTYTFQPRWPIPVEARSMLGVLGRTRPVSYRHWLPGATVQRAAAFKVSMRHLYSGA